MSPIDRGDAPRHVYICGAKSVGQYGGYETFVEKLIESHRDNPDICYFIACKANGDGAMDECLLPGARALSESEFVYHNAHCFKLRVPDIGPAVAIYYDIAALRHCVRHCREHRVQRPIFYMLASRIGPMIAPLRRQIHALGGVLYLNPDGWEFKRAKWSAPVRAYWKLSERLMVKNADLVVCDSVNIESYIRREYAKYHPRTAYIAYGSETAPSPLKDDDPKFTGWLREKDLRPGGYYLVVGRFVPENNFETMIREFMKSRTPRKLALITNVNEAFLSQLERKLAFGKDPRIRFVGTVYDAPLLRKIRENARGYLHGHSVGGTNPSLLEALGATKLNLLLDVGFNREVGQDAALYWSTEPGDLAGLIERADAMSPDEVDRMGERAVARIQTAYSWPFIAGEYEKLWRDDAVPRTGGKQA